MVSLSLNISSSSEAYEHVSAAPSLNYEPSTYSLRTPYVHFNEPPNRYSSFEHLLRPGQKMPIFRSKQQRGARAAKKGMAGNGSEGAALERRKSYGIGGAGNIRRPSEVLYPLRLNADGTRRESVWSTISKSPSEGRRASIRSLFRKGSTATGSDDAAEVSDGK